RTLPSGRKRTTVGLVRPVKTADSEKPGCLKLVAACAPRAASRSATARPAGAMRFEMERCSSKARLLPALARNLRLDVKAEVSPALPPGSMKTCPEEQFSGR